MEWKPARGAGLFSVASGAIRDQKVTFRTRFEHDPGTNPEKLIAAAAKGGCPISKVLKLEIALDLTVLA
jgi:organic hydroperoxide reductase OsmC/OhrA